jgi:hypothetical protein
MIGGQMAVKSAAKGRLICGESAVNFNRNENVLVLAFCSFLMKADLGEAGQNLLIPRWQQE